MKESAEIKVKSLQKAMEILNCFTRKQPLGVTEISEMLGLYKSNVHNVLTTFKALEYLEQDEESGKYRLGSSVFYLCRALGDSFGILDIALPYMQEIVKQVGEIVYLGVPHGDEVIYLEAVYPEESVFLKRSLMGERCKMYCTGIGKAMMSKLPKELIEEYCSRPLVALTEYTITDKQQLKEQLQLANERGYALDNMELEFGVKCVGVPILNAKGEVEAGMSITCPSLRMEDARIQELADILKYYAKVIQQRM